MERKIKLRAFSSPVYGGSTRPAAKAAYDNKRAFARGAGDGGSCRLAPSVRPHRFAMRSATSPVNGRGEESPLSGSTS